MSQGHDMKCGTCFFGWGINNRKLKSHKSDTLCANVPFDVKRDAELLTPEMGTECALTHYSPSL